MSGDMILGATEGVAVNGDELRKSLKRYMKLRGLKAKPWAEKAGIATSVLSNFFNGRSDSLNYSTLEKLAAEQHDSIAILTGESPDPLEQPDNAIPERETDVVVSAQEMTEADVQNLQLMVQLLRGIKDELAGVRDDLAKNRLYLQQLTNESGREQTAGGEHETIEGKRAAMKQ